MEYKLVYAKDFRKLERLVNEKIAEGWVPIGGNSAASNVYTQAMLKEDVGPSAEEIAEAQAKAEAAEKEAAAKAKADRKKALKEEEAKAELED